MGKVVTQNDGRACAGLELMRSRRAAQLGASRKIPNEAMRAAAHEKLRLASEPAFSRVRGIGAHGHIEIAAHADLQGIPVATIKLNAGAEAWIGNLGRGGRGEAGAGNRGAIPALCQGKGNIDGEL